MEYPTFSVKPRSGGKRVARGEHSEPREKGIGGKKPRQGRKVRSHRGFYRSSGDPLYMQYPIPGFFSLTRGYSLGPLPEPDTSKNWRRRHAPSEPPSCNLELVQRNCGRIRRDFVAAGQCRNFVALCKSGIIENTLKKIVKAAAESKYCLADMYKFRCSFPDNMYS